MSAIQASSRARWLGRHGWIRKVVQFVVVATLFGWLYGWLSPHLFPKDTRFGFAYGMMHGAMMPLALPSLLEGQNVELFGASNTGRSYKIGYICGINLCGLIFFGSAFWSPRPKSAPAEARSDTGDHISQPR